MLLSTKFYTHQASGVPSTALVCECLARAPCTVSLLALALINPEELNLPREYSLHHPLIHHHHSVTIITATSRSASFKSREWRNPHYSSTCTDTRPRHFRSTHTPPTRSREFRPFPSPLPLRHRHHPATVTHHPSPPLAPPSIRGAPCTRVTSCLGLVCYTRLAPWGDARGDGKRNESSLCLPSLDFLSTAAPVPSRFFVRWRCHHTAHRTCPPPATSSSSTITPLPILIPRTKQVC